MGIRSRKQQYGARRNFRIAIALIFTLLLLTFGLYLYRAKIIVPSAEVAGPSLSLLRDGSEPINPGDTFRVNIYLDTDGRPADSVDIRYLNFDPQLLQVQDIALRGLMPNSVNRVDNNQGRIELSFGTEGQAYNINDALATTTFKALKEGTANVSFDFTPGSFTESNIIWHDPAVGWPPVIQDILAGVENGTYTIGTPSTATPTPTPSGGGRRRTPTPSPTSQPTENPTPAPSGEPTVEPTPEPTSEPIVGTSTPTAPVIIGKASPTPTPKLSPGVSPKLSPKISPKTSPTAGPVAGFALLPKLIWLVYIGVPLLITLIIYLVWAARNKRLPKTRKPQNNENYPKDVDDDLKI